MNLDNELWVSAALLLKNEPAQPELEIRAIREKLYELNPSRRGQRAVFAYLSDHCVANKKRGKHSIGARIFVDVGHRMRRLYRDGDDVHPDRVRGKSRPEKRELPRKFWHLIDWYDTEYNRIADPAAAPAPADQPDGSGKNWLQFVGYINAHDLRLMRQSIESDFEQVFPDE
ncbi:MAG: hypothetical protein HYX26_01985 [Acidobacteriales bacterium]|nr:hypothetical protein [Terriglobales bacterium]